MKKYFFSLSIVICLLCLTACNDVASEKTPMLNAHSDNKTTNNTIDKNISILGEFTEETTQESKSTEKDNSTPEKFIYISDAYLWKDNEKISEINLLTLTNGQFTDESSFIPFEWNSFEKNNKFYIFWGVGYMNTSHWVRLPKYAVIDKATLEVKFDNLNNLLEDDLTNVFLSPNNQSFVFVIQTYPEDYINSQKNWTESIWKYDLLTQEKTLIGYLEEDESILCSGFEGFYIEGIKWNEDEKTPIIEPHSRQNGCEPLY